MKWAGVKTGFHDIKDGVDSRPQDWTGIDRDDNVWTGSPDGSAVNHGHWKDLYKPLRPYRFKLSLRLRHPTMHPEEISRALNMKPRFQRTVGEPRLRSDGTPLGSLNQYTYWSCEIVQNESVGLVEALDRSVSALEIHKDFLQEFDATGGEVEYFVGWFTTKTSGGDTLGWELLERLANLRIALALDIYGNA